MTSDVIVIGGGFAGLSAATALAEAGRRVLVLEARPGLGGRASSFVDPETGESVDNGQHVLFGCYRETFAFLRRIGTDSDVILQRSLSVDVVDGRGVRTSLTCPAWPPPFHLVAGIMTWRALSIADRVSVLRMRPALEHRESSAPKPDETVKQWLLRHRQTERLIDLLWEPLAVAALNQPIDVAGAVAFHQVLSGLFASAASDASLGLPRKPLGELYAQPARRFIEARGGMVRCGAVASVKLGGTGPPSVEVGDERLTGGAIVCAVPWTGLADVFVEPPVGLVETLDRARRTVWSPIVTVNVWIDRPLGAGAFVGLAGRTFQWVFDKGVLFGERTHHVSMVSSAAETIVAATNEQIATLALRELREALPRAREALVRRTVVVRERRATFSVAPGAPPRPHTETGVPGLYLAGDWIETGLPATIEGAVTSGHRAAQAVLARVPSSA